MLSRVLSKKGLPFHSLCLAITIIFSSTIYVNATPLLNGGNCIIKFLKLNKKEYEVLAHQK
jgi:hypothetical protein